MNVLILFPNGFPVGGASANRVFHLAKAIQGDRKQFEVTILCTRGTESKDNVLNIEPKGVFNGIRFSYVNNNVFWPKSILGRALNIVVGLINTFKYFFFERRNIKFVVSYANYSFFQNLFFWLSCRIFDAKFIYSVDEYPWSLIHGRNRIWDRLYIRFFYRMFDGFVVMTENLMDYYKLVSKSDAKFIHFPMTVDLNRFYLPRQANLVEYIAYCGGDTTGTKDGIDILIKAFNLVKDRFPSLKLYIIGNVHESVKELVIKSALGDRVVLWGFVTGDKIPAFLVNAKALCLARPNNIQAIGGFPTKLGEYLATGNPVIVTNVGEISNYLEDRISAYMVEPGNVTEFANAIVSVLDNYTEAQLIGSRGKKVAEEMFDYSKNSLQLNDFLNSFTVNCS